MVSFGAKEQKYVGLFLLELITTADSLSSYMRSM